MNIQNKTKISLGFIFLLFDYVTEVNGMTFSVLPTFLGFLLLYIGLKDICDMSVYFTRLKKFSLIFTPVFLIIYMITLFGILDKLYNSIVATNPNNPAHVADITNIFLVVQLILNTILILCVIYAVYLFACGCKDVTFKKGTAVARYGRQLYNTFQIYSVLKVLYLIIYSLYTFNKNTLAVAMPIFSLCAMVASIVFIYQENRIYDLLFKKDDESGDDEFEDELSKPKHFRYVNDYVDDEDNEFENNDVE